jgi:Ca-activated chloride channel family protein
MRVTKRWVAAAAAIFSLLGSVSARQAGGEGAREEEVVKVEVDLVTVNVSVTDGGRRPVTGLRAADFLVSDEGRPVRLEFFDGQGPASIVFVVDTSTSMKHDKWAKLKSALKKFLSRAREGNDYTLVAFADRPRLVAESVGAGELWQGVLGLEPAGDTALYDALLLGLEALGRAPRRHRALVLLSDGQDVKSSAGLAEVRLEALARRATIYTVGITLDAEPMHMVEEDRRGRDILKQLAEATGGLVFFPEPEDISRVLDGINADLGGQYTLGYYAADKAPGWRNIQVSLTPAPRQLRLRYQQRYLRR